MGLIFSLNSGASKKNGFDIDLEIGANSIVSEKEGPSKDVSCIGKAKNLQRIMKIRWFWGEEKMSLVESNTGKEMLKEKSLKKPCKPPKPPKALLLDAAEQKMVREMSELAIRKRLRIERMRSIRNMKNANAGFNINNLCVLFVTVFLCGIIIWHGITSSSRGISAVNAHVSHEPSLLDNGDQYH